MFAHRYECQEDTSGTWSVIDTLTGRVCEIGYRDVCRLRESDALAMTEVLNQHPIAPLAQPTAMFHSSGHYSDRAESEPRQARARQG
ncbi:hypothetical protein HHL25_22330 [Rhizobium sp. S-51]|uniref:Uncharacterized protein n=1 Tax=Rhizobium terricola TaxID=2728849 RepID=A0A7Y0B0Q0_9HYPH|nr:hypothetical protein [Rhizobium terricola]NML76883.1 hypothetical protein [Rhizobium terricola]